MRNFFLLLVVLFVASCKAPLPVYFDKPIGTAVDSFPKSMQGNFYFAEEIIDKGLRDYQKVYEVKNGKIVLVKDSVQEILPKENVDVREPSENEFYKIAKLNQLALAHVDSAADVIEKEKGMVFAFVKISKDKISVMIRDSAGADHDVALIRLGADRKLTLSQEEYYLNIKTPYGWEFIKMEEWNKGEFLNVVPFYFTSYNDKSGNINVFLKSAEHIYPGLKPVYNEEKLIIGLKGLSDPKLVRAAFKNSENNFELIRVR